jgi:hypothetical protein
VTLPGEDVTTVVYLCLSVTCSVTNPIRTALGKNQEVHGENPVTNQT